MNSKRYDIVIIPPPEIAAQAIALSQALASQGSHFTLDGVTLYPHISLYHVPFTESALTTVFGALRDIAALTVPFVLRQETYYPDQGVWVGVRYVADKAILDLHTSIIAATRAYRESEEGVRYKEHWVEIPDQELRNIEYCGWAHSFTLYSPHLTFTRLVRPSADVLAHLSQPEFSFRADHIGVYEVGDHGTCTRCVADFHLTG
ncbi:MAG: hypothetical protein WBP40_03390 [Candidatus Moraniibacteriota bacterium]|nr:MAG: hypothetical protein IPJ68_01340 [Candidatus Moranbacteria bacterium]